VTDDGRAPESADDAQRAATRAELAHWKGAAQDLADLDVAASPQAWAGLEEYLERGVRQRLSAVVASLVQDATWLERLADGGGEPAVVRRGLLALRRRSLEAETILDFYGDAIGSRANPATGALLRGFDILASDSMAATLTPLGIEAPPALVYLDKGLGASILRAGVRLWDQAHPSPAAAIKLTRHNLSYPTALLHETGHQVAHLSGWNAELADVLHAAVAPFSSEVAELWQSWASEIAADVHAFAQAGWTPVVALANVVDGESAEVFRIRPGDPHPFGWIRVMFNVALCHSWFGAGPWDAVALAWARRHPAAAADPESRAVARLSVAALPALVDACTRRRMTAFRGRALSDVLPPSRVGPRALAALERQAGASLLTSSYLRRRQSLPILALLAARSATDPADAEGHRRRLRAWVGRLGDDGAAGPLTDSHVAGRRASPSGAAVPAADVPFPVLPSHLVA
jgi:hypothetical protein